MIDIFFHIFFTKFNKFKFELPKNLIFGNKSDAFAYICGAYFIKN